MAKAMQTDFTFSRLALKLARMTLTLYGWRFSIYTRIARLVLAEKGLTARFVDMDPFARPASPVLLRLNPFGTVPVLDHDGFQVFETAAIARYLDEAFDGPALQPVDAKARASMAQVIAIADTKAYRPMVRQVYAGAVFRPAEGLPRDDQAIVAGLADAAQVLVVLDAIAKKGDALQAGLPVTLADLHLAPMIEALVAAPEGAALLQNAPHLLCWWQAIQHRPALLATETGLPDRE